VATTIGADCLRVLKTFIQSWFTTLESALEYDYSRRIFSIVLQKTKKDLGEHAVIAVEELVKVLDLKKEYLYHYNYVGKSTLGFKSDSIVEASFSATKRKKNLISTRKTIDKSAMNIVHDSIERSSYKINKLSQQMEREVCWSRASVKNDITKYSLGLFCKNFDKQKNYFTVRTGELEWMSLYEGEFNKAESKMAAPSFKRVRVITVDREGFMNCTCGKTGEYLLPCQHICSVIKDDKYFTRDIFHIRWQKHFSYAHGCTSGTEMSPEQSKMMTEMLHDTRTNHYKNDGMYKGLPMKGSLFLKNLPKYMDSKKASEKINFMKHLKKLTETAAVPSTSMSLVGNMFKTSSIADSSCDLLGDFSLLSQEEYQESSSFLSIGKKRKHKDDDESPYHKTIEGYEKALDMVNCSADVETINMFFTNFVNQRISERKRHTQTVGKTVLFGENLKIGARIESRNKFLYEFL
jgi:hypothetical protein